MSETVVTGESAPRPDDTAPVAWEVTGTRVCVVRMGLAPVNPLAPALLEGLTEALDAATERGARALVVTTALERFFAAGADIKTMVAADRDEFTAYGAAVRAVVDRIAGLEIPTIAAIEGDALGGGTELALACTLRVASSTSRLSLPEVRLGLIPSAGATQRLPRLVGRGRALSMMLTGQPVTAGHAFDIGLVDLVAAPGQVLAEAIVLAERLAASSAPVLRDLIQLVDASFEVPLVEGLAMEVERVEALVDGADAREGMRAFLEKRPPRFA